MNFIMVISALKFNLGTQGDYFVVQFCMTELQQFYISCFT